MVGRANSGMHCVYKTQELKADVGQHPATLSLLFVAQIYPSVHVKYSAASSQSGAHGDHMAMEITTYIDPH